MFSFETNTAIIMNENEIFTVNVELVNSICQLLNLLGSETLYEVSIELASAFFIRCDGEAVRAPRSVI